MVMSQSAMDLLIKSCSIISMYVFKLLSINYYHTGTSLRVTQTEGGFVYICRFYATY